MSKTMQHLEEGNLEALLEKLDVKVVAEFDYTFSDGQTREMVIWGTDKMLQVQSRNFTEPGFKVFFDMGAPSIFTMGAVEIGLVQETLRQLKQSGLIDS